MSFEDLAVLFVVMQIWVERNWCSAVFYAVVEPLMHGRIEERVAKEIFLVAVGGGAPAKTRGGRAVPQTSRTFDCTKGFPGEDVTSF